MILHIVIHSSRITNHSISSCSDIASTVQDRSGFLKEILSNLRGVIDAVPNPQNVHLLHLVVKKVLIQVLVWDHHWEKKLLWFRIVVEQFR